MVELHCFFSMDVSSERADDSALQRITKVGMYTRSRDLDLPELPMITHVAMQARLYCFFSVNASSDRMT